MTENTDQGRKDFEIQERLVEGKLDGELVKDFLVRRRTLTETSENRDFQSEIPQKVHDSGIGYLVTQMSLPREVAVNSLMPDERVIYLIRAHPFTLLGPLFLGLIPLPIPAVVIYLLQQTAFSNGSLGLTLFFGLIWEALAVAILIGQLLSWYFNVGILTTKRIFDLDWNGIGNYDLSMAPIYKIQDVRVERNGVMRSVLDIGSLYVQTAGTEASIEFLGIPFSQEMANKIEELVIKHKGNVSNHKS